MVTQARVAWGIGVVALAACSPVYLAHAPRASAVVAIPVAASESARGETPPPATSELAGVLAGLVWPLALDRASILSSPYGARVHPQDGATRFHAGLDLRAPEGTPVYAVADGRVVRSGAGGAYGNVVVIDHGAELASLYGHNREILVHEGERVRRGQVIARVGRTGNATGDHLHFELRWRGGTVDPWVVLPRLGGGAR